MVWLRSVVKYGKYNPVKFASFEYVTRGKSYHFRDKNRKLFPRATQIYKIWKLRMAIFSVFY